MTDRRALRLSVVVAAAIAVALGGVAAWKAFGSGDEMPAGMVLYRDHLFGWRAEYPRRMRVREFESSTGLSTSVGTAITNFRVDGRINDVFQLPAEAPSDGVIFILWQLAGSPAPDLWGEEARFPISLSDFEPSRGDGIEPPLRLISFLANGWDLNAGAWFGPRSTDADRNAIRRLIASVRFPRLKSGSVTGGIFQVLGYADEYPVGSVTRFDAAALAEAHHASGSPFYLVHAPGGFYALGWEHDLDGGYKGCDVEFDRSRFEFFCRENGARWNRAGAVITKPMPSHPDDPLNILNTKVGQDGHVLVAQSSTTNRLEPKLWP